MAVDGRARLFVIDISSRRAVAQIENPSGSKSVLSLMKHPAFDAQSRPYVLLKDATGLSLVDVHAKRVLPLIRAASTME